MPTLDLNMVSFTIDMPDDDPCEVSKTRGLEKPISMQFSTVIPPLPFRYANDPPVVESIVCPAQFIVVPETEIELLDVIALKQYVPEVIMSWLKRIYVGPSSAWHSCSCCIKGASTSHWQLNLLLPEFIDTGCAVTPPEF